MLFRVDFYLEDGRRLASCTRSEYLYAVETFNSWLKANPKIKKAFFYENDTLLHSFARD